MRHHEKSKGLSISTLPAFTSTLTALRVRKPELIVRQRRPCMCSAVGNEDGNAVVVALTRGVGKNGKLREATAKALVDVSTVELPCVATTLTQERQNLPAMLREQYDWIVISSPESARVFVESWCESGQPAVGQIAAIGRGTGEVLENAGLKVDFQPSKSTFRVLAAELPESAHHEANVLYPASVKASRNNVLMLEQRGFNVSRINTYSTETAVWSDAERKVCDLVDVATFASPTTVKGWLRNVSQRRDLPVACIGETSATAAKTAGFTNIFYPDKPGISGWVDAIRKASSFTRR